MSQATGAHAAEEGSIESSVGFVEQNPSFESVRLEDGAQCCQRRCRGPLHFNHNVHALHSATVASVAGCVCRLELLRQGRVAPRAVRDRLAQTRIL